MVAVAVSRGRVAPVLDWCTQILLIHPSKDLEHGGIVWDVAASSPYETLERLKNHQVTTLICGALSRELLLYAEGLGLHVVHGVAGEIGQVVEAYGSGRLNEPDFWMPGCRGPRRYRPCRFEFNAKGEKNMAPGKGRGCGFSGGGFAQGRAQGKRQGQGQGRGQGGGGRGRGQGGQGMGMGRGVQGPPAFCVCPDCGEKVPHRQGVPCVNMTCPKCGHSMVRGDVS